MPTAADETSRFAATTELDFFALLSLTPQSTPAELRRQYRKTALLYHPDKNPSADAADKFQLLQTAYDILNDPTLREIYENAYRGREKRRLERDALGKRRRDLISELEQDERGEGKRAKFDDELRKLQADGERRRREKDEALRRTYKEEAARSAKLAESIRADMAQQERDEPLAAETPATDTDLDRSLKVRWYRDRASSPPHDETALHALLARHGQIESVVQLKDKKSLSTSVFVFASLSSANSVMKTDSPTWIKSMAWASGKKELEQPARQGTPASTEQIAPAPTKDANYESNTFARLREAAAKQKAKQQAAKAQAVQSQ